MEKLSLYLLTAIFAVLFASCQKVDLSEDGGRSDDANNVTFRIVRIEETPFSSAKASRSQDIAQLCTRINVAIYKNSERVKSISQKSGDKDFGTVSLSLDAGTYRVVILAHSQEKSPTMTDAEKIGFNSDMSDTFLWSEKVTVEDGGDNEVDVDMHRVVAKIRIISKDNVPNNVARLKFYYTGGSSTINALTGKGCVNSKQTVEYMISDDMKGKPATFEFYTFPKADNSTVKMEVTAYDATDTKLGEMTITDIPVKVNTCASCEGDIFSSISGGGGSIGSSGTKFRLTTDDEWVYENYTF